MWYFCQTFGRKMYYYTVCGYVPVYCFWGLCSAFYSLYLMIIEFLTGLHSQDIL